MVYHLDPNQHPQLDRVEQKDGRLENHFHLRLRLDPEEQSPDGVYWHLEGNHEWAEEQARGVYQAWMSVLGRVPGKQD